MLEVSIEKRRLGEVIDTVGALVDEAVLKFDDDHLQITVVDPANVGLASVTVQHDAFETYKSDQEALGINLIRLSDIIGLAESKDDLVEMELDPDTKKLNVEVSNIQYTLALIDPDSIRDADVPNLNPPVRLELDSAALDRSIKAADMVSDQMAFVVNDGTFELAASGDMDDVDYKPEEEGEGDQIEYLSMGLEDCESQFSLDYLKDMNKAIPSDTRLTTELGDDKPVTFEFEPSEGVSATYTLAPRIDST